MRKSTDYGVGGAAFSMMGMSMIFSIVVATFADTSELVCAFVYISIGAVLLSVGIYWLWKARGFPGAERKAGAQPPSPVRGPP